MALRQHSFKWYWANWAKLLAETVTNSMSGSSDGALGTKEEGLLGDDGHMSRK